MRGKVAFRRPSRSPIMVDCGCSPHRNCWDEITCRHRQKGASSIRESAGERLRPRRLADPRIAYLYHPSCCQSRPRVNSRFRSSPLRGKAESGWASTPSPRLSCARSSVPVPSIVWSAPFAVRCYLPRSASAATALHLGQNQLGYIGPGVLLALVLGVPALHTTCLPT